MGLCLMRTPSPGKQEWRGLVAKAAALDFKGSSSNVAVLPSSWSTWVWLERQWHCTMKSGLPTAKFWLQLNKYFLWNSLPRRSSTKGPHSRKRRKALFSKRPAPYKVDTRIPAHKLEFILNTLKIFITPLAPGLPSSLHYLFSWFFQGNNNLQI